jgi:TRAP-type C4-dicarboxylate transport system substrate-binding protein
MTIPEIPKGLSTGAATFSNVPTNNYPDIMPLNARILELPFLGLQDPVESSEIYMQLLDEFPEMMQEFSDYNMYPLAVTTLGMYGMHFTDTKEVHVPADLNGRQIVPYKLEFLPMLEANNAAGSYIPPGQIYEALEKGVVGGYVNNWAFQGWFGLTELMRQHVEMGEYGAFHEFNVICVNLDFYNSLPKDLQQLLTDTFRTNGGYKDMWQDTSDLVDSEKAKAEAKGDVFINLTPEELDVWKAAVEGNHEIALDEIAAQRGDTAGNDIYERAKEIIAEKYGA